MHIRRIALVFVLLSGVAQMIEARSVQNAEPLEAIARMPVKEVTVFKDGHAFVLHQGEMPTNAAGNVVMDYLPAPVLGTFWPYSAENGVRLDSVVASHRRVLVERTALSVTEMLRSNPGARVMVTERDGARYAATVVGAPVRTVQELQRTLPPGAVDLLPERSAVVLLKTQDGVKVVSLDQIRDVTFADSPRPSVADEEYRNMLTLKLDWNGRAPAKTANVGLLYLQEGIRWIPSYKIEIDGNGAAAIKLQATLVNDLTDLEDATANLVIGVPSFAFKDMIDPISLQQAVAELSPALQRGLTSGALSNAIATQVASPAQMTSSSGSASTGTELSDAAKSEDLFVFTVKHVNLKKGERVVIPVAEFPLSYKDVYTVDLPFLPPPSVRVNLTPDQQEQFSRALNAPAAMHKIRMENKSQYPLTTAPAMIVRGDRLVAQAMMQYTAVNGTVDLDLTRAVDLQVAKSETETGRTPNATTVDGNQYARIDLKSSVKVTNYKDRAVYLEVSSTVPGNVGSADNGGKVEKLNVMGDSRFPGIGSAPFWWNSYGWPNWWNQLNGVGRVTWKLNLEPGKSVNLGYTWNYFWR